MKYFDTLPKVVYTDKNRISRIFTNIITRASVSSKIKDNPLVFYSYDIQDGDTPEIVAQKYYGNSYRYWIVLYCNNLLDPLWDWPLNSLDFQRYIADKYAGSNPYNTVHHYEKVITQYDQTTRITTTNTIIISEDVYNSLVESKRTYTLNSGQVDITVTKKIVSNYDYELDLNESKRSIKLLNNTYAEQLETELKNLMK